jgi:hypothetical protein
MMIISTVIKTMYITATSVTFVGLCGFFGKESLNVLPGIIISSLGWPILGLINVIYINPHTIISELDLHS